MCVNFCSSDIREIRRTEYKTTESLFLHIGACNILRSASLRKNLILVNFVSIRIYISIRIVYIREPNAKYK